MPELPPPLWLLNADAFVAASFHASDDMEVVSIGVAALVFVVNVSVFVAVNTLDFRLTFAESVKDVILISEFKLKLLPLLLLLLLLLLITLLILFVLVLLPLLLPVLLSIVAFTMGLTTRIQLLILLFSLRLLLSL